MTSQVILGELDKGLRGRGSLGSPGKDLRVEVLAELLNPDCILASGRGYSKCAIGRLPVDFRRGSDRLPAKLCCASPVCPVPREADEARSGASTSEGAPERADHSIASSLSFVRRAAAYVECLTPLAPLAVRNEPVRGWGQGVVGWYRKGARAAV